jgi:hypothetical protein
MQWKQLLYLKILNINIFQNISTTILLDKNNKKSIEELFTKNLKMAEKSKMADIGSAKNCHNSTDEYFFVFSAGLFLEKFNLTKKKMYLSSKLKMAIKI